MVLRLISIGQLRCIYHGDDVASDILKIPNISHYIHQCVRFNYITNASHDTSVNRKYLFIQDTIEKGLVFNPPKQTVVDCCVDTYFSELRGH